MKSYNDYINEIESQLNESIFYGRNLENPVEKYDYNELKLEMSICLKKILKAKTEWFSYAQEFIKVLWNINYMNYNKDEISCSLNDLIVELDKIVRLSDNDGKELLNQILKKFRIRHYDFGYFQYVIEKLRQIFSIGESMSFDEITENESYEILLNQVEELKESYKSYHQTDELDSLDEEEKQEISEDILDFIDNFEMID